MSDQQTIERIQQERHSANHDRLYQATLKEVQENKKQVPCYNLNELKISHHNHMLNRYETLVPIHWLETVGVLITEVFHQKKAVKAIGMHTQYDLENVLQNILDTLKNSCPISRKTGTKIVYENLKSSVKHLVKCGYDDHFDLEDDDIIDGGK